MLFVHNTQGVVVPCIAAYMLLLEPCMSRPYPVGENMAGHKLASLYIIILCLLAVQSRLHRLYWEVGDSCQCMRPSGWIV